MSESHPEIVTNEPFKSHPSESTLKWGIGGGTCTLVVHATGKQTGQACSIAEHIWEPGDIGGFHTHLLEDEAFFVIEGQVTVRMPDDGETFIARAGELIWHPRGRKHNYEVSANGPVRLLQILIPGTNLVPHFFAAVGAGQADEIGTDEGAKAFFDWSRETFGIEFLSGRRSGVSTSSGEVAASTPTTVVNPPACGQIRMTLVWASGEGGLGQGPNAPRRLADALASALDARVVLLTYGFGPGQIYPSAVTDVYQAVEWARATTGASHFPVGVGGDRLGAAMAVATTQLAFRYGETPADLQVLLAPILDVRMRSPSWDLDCSGSTQATVDAALRVAAPGLDRSDPLLSPLLASVDRETPPTVIVTTEHDPFRDDGERYAQELRTARVRMLGHRYESMSHRVACDGGASPEGLRVLAGLASAVAALLATCDNECKTSSSRSNDARLLPCD